MNLSINCVIYNTPISSEVLSSEAHYGQFIINIVSRFGASQKITGNNQYQFQLLSEWFRGYIDDQDAADTGMNE